MQIFLDDTDYQKFLYILADVLDAWDVDCWDACLMPNHYHLALMNRQPTLPQALQQLNGEYASWWNVRHGRVGHVFQGRYKDQIVQREGYLLSLVRYIALNPVRARLVETPGDWRWSTYRYTAGLAPNPGFVRSELVLAQFGEAAPGVLRERYIRHVMPDLSPDEEEQFKRFRSRQRVLGDRPFKRNILRSPSAVGISATAVDAAVAAGCA